MATQNQINNRSQSLTTTTFVSAGTTVTGATGLVATTGGVNATGHSILNGGVVDIGTDNAGNTISIGTGNVARTINLGFSAADHQIHIGVGSGAAAVDIESGSGGSTLNSVGGSATVSGSTGTTVSSAAGSVSITGNTGVTVTGTNNAVTINSGTGVLGISTDASATTLNIGTGGAAKTVTVGSTNTTSTTNLHAGSGGVVLQSVAAGAVVANSSSVLSTVNAAAGTILTSNGAGNAPSFQAAAGGSITITGDSGGGLTSASFTFTGGSTGLTFAGAGSTETLGGTLAIANGGTNATSMATSTGIVKYDGTRLVTSSTAKIDSSNRYTNTSQPAFLAYLSAAVNNVTGDNTFYAVVWDSTKYDQNSNFDTTTGVFTAPVTGKYLFVCNLLLSGFGAAHNDCFMEVVTTGQNYVLVATNPFVVQEATFAQYLMGGSVVVSMSATNTAYIGIAVGNGTKTVGIFSNGGPQYASFSGTLLC